MKTARVTATLACFVLLLCVFSPAQSTNATIMGRVLDPSKAVVPGAAVEATNVDTKEVRKAESNDAGLFTVANLPPGIYRLSVAKPGFRSIVKPSLILHVQDVVALNFELEVGSTSEVVTVEGGTPLVNTQDASVSTVVDRQLVGNLPLNGRSFQSLLQLTPGYVAVPASTSQPGQFSINGQRPDANYITVDGVSANVGTMAVALPGAGASGALPGTTAFGGTNNVASVDAVEEFRVQTSSFAPEYGRQPGAQISVVTRSGTNALHGTAFDYLRNDVLDANNWFADHNHLAKPKERQNDFGGVLGGPVWRNHTFFFVSYEGLRLQQPVVSTEQVPTPGARASAPAAAQPYLNVFPLPNGPAVQNGIALFSASYSVPSTLNATSIRVDQRLGDNSVLFMRYNHAPSTTRPRGLFGDTSAEVDSLIQSTDTLTVGHDILLFHLIQNDLRLNWSRGATSAFDRIDSFHGATPLQSNPSFPSAFTPSNSFFQVFLQDFSLVAANGRSFDNAQNQINVVDTAALSKGSHQLKWGVDYRDLGARIGPATYTQQVIFDDVNKMTQASTVFVNSTGNHYPVTHNLSLFLQDSWRMTPRLTITYGLRWEHNPPPDEAHGNVPYTLSGIDNLATATIAPKGTPLWNTTNRDFAPRFGVAYALGSSSQFQTVLRGGAGVFYDLPSAQAVNGVSVGPYSLTNTLANVPVPFPATAIAPPTLTFAPPFSVLYPVIPNFRLPYTAQWNVAVQQALGAAQALTITYAGSSGQRLVRLETVNRPNPSVSIVRLITNDGKSNYNGLQVQLERRMAKGLQGLASYAWSKSLDNVSSDGTVTVLSGKLDPNIDRGPSDFDIRHTFSGGLSYDLPAVHQHSWAAVVNGWGLDASALARTAPPVNVIAATDSLGFGVFNSSRPNVVPGVPFYISDVTVPGGKRINRLAFATPPKGQQGNLERNGLRAFGAAQIDLVVRRTFPIRERVKLQFRAELFNVLNHPNFAMPCTGCGLATVQNLSSPLFGVSTTTLAQALGTGGQSGGFNPLYQIGGPRSGQLALKLTF